MHIYIYRGERGVERGSKRDTDRESERDTCIGNNTFIVYMCIHINKYIYMYMFIYIYIYIYMFRV